MGATLALEALGLSKRLEHVLVSEKDAHVRAIIAHNFDVPLKKISRDLMERDNSKAPVCDIYTAGFPCQPFSSEGLREGVLDSKGRGVVGYKVVDYIERAMPKIFILENVKGFQTDKFKPFRMEMLMRLKAIRRNGERAYIITSRVLNSQDHGVAQSRARYYMVGLRADAVVAGRAFAWPGPVPTPPLKAFLDAGRGAGDEHELPDAEGPLRKILRAEKEIKKRGHDASKKPYVCDIQSGRRGLTLMLNRSPCLTRTRCGAGGFYLVHKMRLMRSTEMARLQGIPDGRLELPPEGVTKRQLAMCFGNSFTVTVFERLLARAMQVVGLAAVPDPLGQ